MTRRAILLLLLCLPTLGSTAFGRTQTAAPAQAQPVSAYAILFERTGGYIGRHDRFWIYPDGRIVNEGGTVKIIRPQSVQAFLKQIEPLAASGSPKVPQWRSMCCDCYQYRITIATDSGVRSIVFSEPLPAKSDRLAQLTQELRDLLFRK